jgi:hypothetical protein
MELPMTQRWRKGDVVAKDGDKIVYADACPGEGWIEAGYDFIDAGDCFHLVTPNGELGVGELIDHGPKR